MIAFVRQHTSRCGCDLRRWPGRSDRIAFGWRADALLRSRRIGDRQLAQLPRIVATVLHDGQSAGGAVALGLGPLVVSVARPAGAPTPLDPAGTGRGRRSWGRTRPVSRHASDRRRGYPLVARRDTRHCLAADRRDALPGPGAAQKPERKRTRPLGRAKRSHRAVAWGRIARIRLSGCLQPRLPHGPAPWRKIPPHNGSFSQRQAAKPSCLLLRDRQLIPPPAPQDRPHAAPIVEEECPHRTPRRQWFRSCRHRSRREKPAIEATALRKLHVPTRNPAMALTTRPILRTSSLPILCQTRNHGRFPQRKLDCGLVFRSTRVDCRHRHGLPLTRTIPLHRGLLGDVADRVRHSTLPETVRPRTLRPFSLAQVTGSGPDDTRSRIRVTSRSESDRRTSAVEHSMRPCRPCPDVGSVPGAGHTVPATLDSSHPDRKPGQVKTASRVIWAPDSISSRSCRSRFVRTRRRTAPSSANRCSRAEKFQ